MRRSRSSPPQPSRWRWIVAAGAVGTLSCSDLLGLGDYTSGAGGASGGAGAAGGAGATGGGGEGGTAGASPGVEATLGWIASYSGGGDQFAAGLATTGSGKVLLCGNMGGSMTTDTTTLASPNDSDGFLVQIQPAGVEEWARAISGLGDQFCGGVAVVGAETVVTGSFSNSLLFDTNQQPQQAASTHYQIFVGRLNTQGEALALATLFPNDDFAGHDGDAFARSIARMPQGVLVGGSFKGFIDSNGDQAIGSNSIPTAFAAHTFSGTTWLAPIGESTTAQSVLDVATDGIGNSVVVGSTEGALLLPGVPEPEVGSNGDALVVGFDSSGQGLYAFTGYGPESNEARAVAIDAESDDVLVVGTFRGQMTFAGQDVTAVAGTDVFVARLRNGGLGWIKAFGGQGNESGWGAASDSAGNVYLTGDFTDAFDFGGATLIPQGAVDGFVASLTPDGEHRFSFAVGGTQTTRVSQVAVDSSDRVVIAGSASSPTTTLLGNGFDNVDGDQNVFVASFTVQPAAER